MNNKRMLGNALLLLTAIIWGTAFVAQRVGMESIEPLTFNAARMALAAIVVGLVSFIMWQKKHNAVHHLSATESIGQARYTDGLSDTMDKNTRYTIIGGISCGICLSAASITQQMGIVYTTAGKAGFITAMYMLLVPIIGFFVFGRKNTWLTWAAVLLGVAGMYLLCITEEFSLSRGDTLVCICAVFFSCHILCCDYFVEYGDPIRISAIQFATATLISGVFAVIFEEPTAEKLISAAVPILYCGIVSGGVGYTLQMVAQKFTEPTVASLLMSLESVFALIAGVIILNEHMSLRELSGCIIMFTAVILVQIPIPESLPGGHENS